MRVDDLGIPRHANDDVAVYQNMHKILAALSLFVEADDDTRDVFNNAVNEISYPNLQPNVSLFSRCLKLEYLRVSSH